MQDNSKIIKALEAIRNFDYTLQNAKKNKYQKAQTKVNALKGLAGGLTAAYGSANPPEPVQKMINDIKSINVEKNGNFKMNNSFLYSAKNGYADKLGAIINGFQNTIDDAIAGLKESKQEITNPLEKTVIQSEIPSLEEDVVLKNIVEKYNTAVAISTVDKDAQRDKFVNGFEKTNSELSKKAGKCFDALYSYYKGAKINDNGESISKKPTAWESVKAFLYAVVTLSMGRSTRDNKNKFAELVKEQKNKVPSLGRS